jgi:hypothetical protein
MTLFPQEIYRKPPRLLFSGLQARLIQRLREEVRNGTITERGLARKAELSQPHVHNLLKGIRTLSAESADALLGAMSWGVPDLIAPEETGIEAAFGAEPRAGVPLLSGAVGPGGWWGEDIESERNVTVPCRFLAALTAPAAMQLLPDPEMRTGAGFVLVDRGRESRAVLDGLSVYVVARGGEARLRYVRFGREVVYLPTAENLNWPYEWEVVARRGNITELVLARVCPVPGHHLRSAAAFR